MDVGENIIGLVAVIMVFSIILIPVAGFTARFALKPAIETLNRYFQQRETEETVKVLERRVAFLEQQIEQIETHVERVDDVRRFERELESGLD